MGTRRKKCKVVMLPSKYKQAGSIITIGDTLHYTEKYPSENGYVSQHLYITSDDEIKEGDCCINNKKEIFKVKNSAGNILHNPSTKEPFQKWIGKKIIATTDKSLKIKDDWNNFMDRAKRLGVSPSLLEEKEGGMNISLPQPSKAFIEKYCEVGGINEVIVEYILYSDSQTFHFTPLIKLSNEITIHPIKEKMYSRKELLDFVSPLIGKLESEFGDPTKEGIEIAKEKWIKGNL